MVFPFSSHFPFIYSMIAGSLRFSHDFPVVFSPVVIIGALGSTALAANEFLLRSTLAVPRDERLAGWRSSS